MMNTLKKYWVWILSASRISAVVALVIGAYIGYQVGLHAYDNLFFDEALADIYYTDNPVDSPPCAEEKIYEWFYVELPIDNHLPEEDEIPKANEEGGSVMDP
ncbi:hypothetical protein [Parapedobacter soli]|uniref:hypothetical protein n=1 Tax=Parapedobacter soli TaxID=416955 RepID=UPI0021C842A5|nr:hypothetical protein [Parapedobacter soli]